jgi:hypothetical protein
LYARLSSLTVYPDDPIFLVSTAFVPEICDEAGFAALSVTFCPKVHVVAVRTSCFNMNSYFLPVYNVSPIIIP